METAKAKKIAKADAIGAFMFELSEQDDVLTEFNDKLWIATIESVTVQVDGALTFCFKNGMKITV